MSQNETNGKETVVRISAAIVSIILTIICGLIATIYLSLASRVSIVEAKYDRVSVNIAIICATVSAKCVQ